MIVQPRAFEYRKAFYRGLDSSLREHGIELTVAVGQGAGPRADSFEDPYVLVTGDRLSQLTRDKLRWRSPSRVRKEAGGPDLLVVEQAIKNIDTYRWMLHRPHRRSIAFWGHGRSFSTHQASVPAAWKQALTRQGAWFFAYTEEGADCVVENGFPRACVTVVRNTLDVEGMRTRLAEVSAEQVSDLRDRLRLTPGRTALFIGGVDPAKDVDFLLEAAREARRLLPGFVLLVGGAGQSLEQVREVERAGGPVRALGRIEQDRKALAMATSDVMMIPTWIGLVAVDSFVSGLPIVTRRDRSHSPEAAYLASGIDSQWLPKRVSPYVYATAVTSLMQDPGELQRLGKNCRLRAGEYLMQVMIDRFTEGVLAWDEMRRFRL